MLEVDSLLTRKKAKKQAEKLPLYYYSCWPPYGFIHCQFKQSFTMEDEAVRMSWLSGLPRRVFNLRAPPEFSRNYSGYGAQWSVMDDQILLTFDEQADGILHSRPSSIFLADVRDILGKADDVVEFRKIVKLPFDATRSRLLSHRAGFVTAELREE
jgi:hypothetical protein